MYHTFCLPSDSLDQSATSPENNNGQCYWPDIKWRSENGTSAQVDMYRLIACCRVHNCRILAVVLHRLADYYGSFVSFDGDTLRYDNLRALRSAETGDRWSDWPSYFTNERAFDRDPCSKGACMGRKFPRKSTRSEKVRVSGISKPHMRWRFCCGEIIWGVQIYSMKPFEVWCNRTLNFINLKDGIFPSV